MSQLILPNSIDAGTEIQAAEHQANYVAIRDLINGNLEGGATAAGNIKAKGLTAREIEDVLLASSMSTSEYQPGIYLPSDAKVTPGAGLGLNIAAGSGRIKDTGAVVSGNNALLPFTYAGGTLTIAANASGNPRIDQIIATLTGFGTATVSVLQGTATAAATLDNRNGAAALPASSIRLADLLMPTGFGGPFVQTTHIRDRRPWVRGALYVFERAAGDYAITSTTFADVDATNLNMRLEFSGNPVEVILSPGIIQASAGLTAKIQLLDGSTAGREHWDNHAAAGAFRGYPFAWQFTPTVGSHLLKVQALVTGGTYTLGASATGSLSFRIREILQTTGSNDGA